MIKKITALKARQNLGQLLEEVFYKGDQYIIERAGKPMAAVVPVALLDEWQKRREQFFQKVETVWTRNQDSDGDEVEAVILEASQATQSSPVDENAQSRS